MQSWNTIGSHSVTESNSKKNRGKLKSLEESNYFAPISPNFSASSISFDGSSVFWSSDSDVNSEIVERKAYPLPQPVSSSAPRTIDAYQRVSGFVSQNMSISSSSSTGFSSDNEDFVPDHPDFGSFRVWEDSMGSPVANHESGRHPCHPLPLPPSLPIGSSQHRQSKWKKGRLLGRGTFGHVYAGFNSENGQMCAIKEVRVISDDRSSNECLKQLNQEITLLSKLSHPNIVQYYGSELGGDKLSVYLEYVSGGSIHKLLREYGPFNEHVIQSYTRQILSGIAYLHRKDTVHRDIKGANILVDPNGEIKLVDFGMAKRIASYSSMLSFKGSPYWMAPEVITNASGSSLPVDIWSLGCTVLEMATAKPPWSQYEGVAAIFKIANSKDFPEIPNWLSKNAQNFVKHCLRRDPSARPTAAQLLRHPFLKNQMTIEVANFDSVHETFPSTFDSRQSMTAANFHSSRPTDLPQ